MRPREGAGGRRAPPSGLVLVAAATLILLLTNGGRQSLGLFVDPIVRGGGVALASVSLALAIGQLVWGLAQPAFGVLAERIGSVRTVGAGALLMCAGLALAAGWNSALGLTVGLGVLSAAGAAAGSFPILMAALAQRLEPERRGLAAGVLNAGASTGQVLFAPLNQVLIGAWGWSAAMACLGGLMLLTVPLALMAGRGADLAAAAHRPAAQGLRAQLRAAAREPSYWLLQAGFFTCGFHVAFLATHLPGEARLCGLPAATAANAIALIGLANIAGSIAAGVLGNRYRMKYLLAATYFVRALAVLAYLASPRDTASLYAFAAVLGFTWLSTVPLTAGITAKLFGTRHLATLFGLTMVTHQAGAFLGAWAGGLVLTRFGNFHWMWYADVVLALGAALVNLPIREAAPATATVAARHVVK